VSPSIGQGCNASLEDVLILGHLLETYKDDWGKVLPAFLSNGFPMPMPPGVVGLFVSSQQEVGG